MQYLLLPPQLEDHAGVFTKIKSQFREVARSENEFHEGAVLYRRIGS